MHLSWFIILKTKKNMNIHKYNNVRLKNSGPVYLKLIKRRVNYNNSLPKLQRLPKSLEIQQKPFLYPNYPYWWVISKMVGAFRDIFLNMEGFSQIIKLLDGLCNFTITWEGDHNLPFKERKIMKWWGESNQK